MLERVAEAGKQRTQLLGGKEIEQHQHVRLLRELVAVCAVVLRFENQIQALNVAITDAVGFPIELRERFIALELIDDPIGTERHEHPLADVGPARNFVRG